MSCLVGIAKDLAARLQDMARFPTFHGFQGCGLQWGSTTGEIGGDTLQCVGPEGILVAKSQ